MENLINGYRKYLLEFTHLADKTGIIKKEIFISYIICRYYDRYLKSHELKDIHEQLKESDIKTKLFEKYIIETLIGVSEGNDKEVIESFKSNLIKLKNKNIKLNYITKLFVLVCHKNMVGDEFVANYYSIVKSNYFIKKTKLLPIVHFINKFELSINVFEKKYKELINQGFVKSSELMYLTLLSLKFEIEIKYEDILIEKRSLYCIFLLIKHLNIDISIEKILIDVNFIKEESKVHLYEDNLTLIVLLEYLFENHFIKIRENNDIFEIIILQALVSLMKEISYLD